VLLFRDRDALKQAIADTKAGTYKDIYRAAVADKLPPGRR
jgi:hypothetical protein